MVEQIHLADELDDGLEYEVDTVDYVEEDVAPVSEDESSETTAPVENSKKRTRNPKLQEKKKMKMAMDIDQKRNLSTETSPEVIVDYINDAIRRKNVDLSTLELAELYFKKTDVRSSAEFAETRTLENLPKFINGRFSNMLPSNTPGKKNTKPKTKREKKDLKYKKGKKEEEPPQPPRKHYVPSDEERKFIAIVSMSAIRACDVHRALGDIPGASLKLINKNKLHVDLKLVQSTWSRVLCCTPGRLLKVLKSEESGLTNNEVKIVIVDNSYLDQKMQNIWDIKETTDALKEMAAGGSKIYLY